MTISYQEIGCQIEINQKGQIQITGFALFCWDIICKSHGFQPVDVSAVMAGIFNVYNNRRP